MAAVKDPRYRTYLAEKTTKARSHFYMNAYPEEVGGNVWLRVWTGASLVSTLDRAYQAGRPVSVTIGRPDTSPDGQKTSTVKTASIIWDG